jgi:hypothetical protein
MSRDELNEAIALLIDGTVLKKIDRHNADGFVAAVVTVSKAARWAASFPSEGLRKAIGLIEVQDPVDLGGVHLGQLIGDEGIDRIMAALEAVALDPKERNE